ncbi:hypothetical protein [Bacillus paranthracis]|uniref:hypothetical protein n=1 Tax=Bacillus paranthracis TaxID=2026186 RepID=UPI001582B431|nr:hypothetical protein [Bacillus paranthracis]NUJ08480.1 hypothetical protein [Bacillus paranthracis]NUJ08521.1 hypothetical protein [Bacillus paranthracis]
MEQRMIDEALQYGIEFGKQLKNRNINVVAAGQKLNHLQQTNQEKFIEVYLELSVQIGITVNKSIAAGDKTLIQSFLIGLSQEF